jgi:hypothetical protein
METTNQEQAQVQELNQDRHKDNENEKQDSPINQNAEQSSHITTLLIFLPLAIIADLVDGLDITGFLAIFTRIIDIPIVLTLWLWRALKNGKGVNKNYTYQLFATFLLELSPFGMIPAWTTFVLYTYFKDKSSGRKFLAKTSKAQRIKIKENK